MHNLLSKFTRSLSTGVCHSWHLQFNGNSYALIHDGAHSQIKELVDADSIPSALDALENFGFFNAESGEVTELVWNQRLVPWGDRRKISVSSPRAAQNNFATQIDVNCLKDAVRFGARDDLYLIVDQRVYVAITFLDGTTTWIALEEDYFEVAAIGSAVVAPLERRWVASTTLCTNKKSKVLAREPDVYFSREVLSNENLTLIRFHKFQPIFDPAIQEDTREWLHHLGLLWDSEYEPIKRVEIEAGTYEEEFGIFQFRFDSGLLADVYESFIQDAGIPVAADSLLTIEVGLDSMGHAQVSAKNYLGSDSDYFDVVYVQDEFEIRMNSAAMKTQRFMSDEDDLW